MAVRLGEMMLHAGMLTPNQLEEVLRSQAAFGGRLGTNLVEMGLIEERDLVRLLHEKLGVTCIDGSALKNVPESVLSVVPRELVIKHRVLPVALNHKRLTVAMVDPSDFAAIEEIGFVTGLVVIPCVATELSLALALERYYGIKRETRYIPVAGGIHSKFISRTQSGEQPSGRGAALPNRGGDAGAEGGGLTLPALARRLADVTDRGAVVTALLDYLAGQSPRGAFLVLTGGKLAGVKAMAHGVEVSGFSSYVCDLSKLPFLQTVLREKAFYLGDLPMGEGAEQLIARLGGGSPHAVLMLPILLDGEVVALLYAEEGEVKMSSAISELQQVAHKGALAFKMLGVRKKILSC